MSGPSAPVDVLVFGAGAIGFYVGGSLALAGRRVHFVARPGVVALMQAEGLRVAALDQPARQLSSDQFGVSLSVAEAPAARLLLLAVKGTATTQADGWQPPPTVPAPASANTVAPFRAWRSFQLIVAGADGGHH